MWKSNSFLQTVTIKSRDNGNGLGQSSGTVWYAHYIPDSHAHRLTSTKCSKNTVFSPDDGHIVARNMWRFINILRINCAPSWHCLQDYTVMHSQQNITFDFNPLTFSHHSRREEKRMTHEEKMEEPTWVWGLWNRHYSLHFQFHNNDDDDDDDKLSSILYYNEL